MNIYFVRHAQSTANIDANVLKTATNMSIGLSKVGQQQAEETGLFLANHLSSENSIKVWNSPYNRTRQTAQAIKDNLIKSNLKFTEEESIYVAERQFGLVDDVEDYHKNYPYEAKHWQMHKEHSHDFFARPPLGESGFDMCLRLDFFLKHVVGGEQSVKNHIVVSHGAAIRGLLMMNQKWTYEKFNQPNPFNASVILVNDNKLEGCIFTPTQKTV